MVGIAREMQRSASKIFTESWKIPFQVLIDEQDAVSKQYQAMNGSCFLVDAKGKIALTGNGMEAAEAVEHYLNKT